uniref:Leucine rich immune protein (Short) n=1 Tax=Anopheles melas TaxID=34690 RepID=A0A1Y9IND7_9DIPT
MIGFTPLPFLLFISLLAIPPTSASSSRNAIECSRVQPNSTCFIEGVSFESTADEYLTIFPPATHIIMQASEILHFAPHLFDALAGTAFLTLKGSIIPALTFRSDELRSLRIDATELRELAVAPLVNRHLNTLIITGNPLSVIPPTVRYLTGLSMLDLSNNRLQHVQLGWFEPMASLLVLDLSGNRITRLDVHASLRLVRLENFWTNHNQLRRIEFFPRFAPALRRVRLVENYWACEWVAQVRELIWAKQIQVHGAEHSCPEAQDGGLCCYEGQQPFTELDSGWEQEANSYDERGQFGKTYARVESYLQPRDQIHREGQPDRTCNVLEQKYRTLVDEKELLERRFINTVRELERTVRRLTAELIEAQDRLRTQHVRLA